MDRYGQILVDTGYAGGFPHFVKMLEKHHIKPEEIKYLFLTHAYDDHAGFLNEVLKATGAEVILHPKAIEGLPGLRRTTVWVEDLEQYKQSWEMIIRKNPEMICPAHGKPFKTEDLRKYLNTLDKVKLYPLKA